MFSKFTLIVPFLLSVLIVSSYAFKAAAQTTDLCGKLITLETHEGSKTNYSLAGPTKGAAFALVLLPGGSGFIDLDAAGCPQNLIGNSLVQSRTFFHQQGFVTALLDAPSDYQEGDGLGGFRISSMHADDIGKVIDDVRKRTKLPVWLIGTSRGAISAANVASRQSGGQTPDGLVLTSSVTSGYDGGRKAWVAQTVFSTNLELIKMPVLIIAHAEDKCIRTPPDLAADIAEKTNGAREQTVLVSGGPGWKGKKGVKACRGKSPHGFFKQRATVAAGISRFIRGGKY